MEPRETSIVVVDDSADVAEVLALELEAAGYRVETAHSAEETVLKVERLQPRCVILDIGMPGIDGGSLAECLRYRYRDQLTLIAVTGLDSQDARARQTASVVDHYFEKPVNLSVLVSCLQTARGVSEAVRRP